MSTQNLRIQLRRDVSTEWAKPTVNPKLFAGEMGIETDTNRAKIGTGTSNWNDLPYLALGIKSASGGIEVDASGDISFDASALTTDDIAEGINNLYYTPSRTTNAISLDYAPAMEGGTLTYAPNNGKFTYAPVDAYTKVDVDAAIAVVDAALTVEVDARGAGDDALNTAIDFENARITVLEGGVAGPKADLVGGLIPIEQIPSISVQRFIGVVADSSELTTVSGADQVGDFVINEDTGTTFVLTATPSTDVNNWRELTAAGAAVLNVNNQTGPSVSLTAASFDDIYSKGEVNLIVSTQAAETDTALALKADLAGAAFTGDVDVNANFQVAGTLFAGTGASITGNLVATGTVSSTFSGDLTGNVLGDVTGDLTGDVTGDLTGDVTGDVTGDLTGDVLGDLVGDVTGNVSGNVYSTDGNNEILVDASQLTLRGRHVAADGTVILAPGTDGSDASIVVNTASIAVGTIGNVQGTTGTFTGQLNLNSGMVGDSTGDHIGRVLASDRTSVVLDAKDGVDDAVFTGNVTGNADTATLAATATVAEGLTGTPDISVGAVTATTGAFTGAITSGATQTSATTGAELATAGMVQLVKSQIETAYVTADSVVDAAFKSADAAILDGTTAFTSLNVNGTQHTSFFNGDYNSLSNQPTLGTAAAAATTDFAPATGSANYAPATGSTEYAPSSGSTEYAPATGSTVYAPATGSTVYATILGTMSVTQLKAAVANDYAAFKAYILALP